MSNDIQAMRLIYDVIKTSRDNEKNLTDEEIEILLNRMIVDESIRKNFDRFQKGYAAEGLFQRIFSLLPWVKLIVPLGQEQFPNISKEMYQVHDYEVTFEAGDKDTLRNLLIEVKLIDGDKQTFELPKYKYAVLKEYSDVKRVPLLIAIFWKKNHIWTINSIEAFSEKSSCFKISFENAYLNDLSAIFGDYTYIFPSTWYRKSQYINADCKNEEYPYSHEIYGKTIYDSLSTDNVQYTKINFLQAAVLDSAFDFKEISHEQIDEKTTLIESSCNSPLVYKLSSLLISFFTKIYCYDNNDMYCKNNQVIPHAFNIVDSVRQLSGGERFYLMPHQKGDITTSLISLQFGRANHIYNIYENSDREPNYLLLASHK